MKRRILISLFLVFVLLVNTSLAASVDDSIMFTPEITIALKITDWFSSGTNRALLAFSLAANAADDRVLGKAELLYSVMANNPTFVGKDKSSDSLVVVNVCESEMFLIYYSPSLKQAYATSIPHDKGIELGAITFESAMAELCSEYYRITDKEMEVCIQYIRSQLQ